MTLRPKGRGASVTGGGVPGREAHLADQAAELRGAQISIDATENGDCDHDVAQDAAQIVKHVDANCGRPNRPRVRSLASSVCAPRGRRGQAASSDFLNPHSPEDTHSKGKLISAEREEELVGGGRGLSPPRGSCLLGSLHLLYSQSSLDISSLWV